MSEEIYRELSKKLLLEQSVLLPKIWAGVADPVDAAILNAAPGTVDDIAGYLGMDTGEVEKRLQDLYMRGAAFEKTRDGKTTWRMPRNIVQFHDASLLWKEIPSSLVSLWVEFMETEYPELLKLVTTHGIPSFMRVVPINVILEPQSQVLAGEDARRMVEEAEKLAVVNCVCRLSKQKCDAPLEVCLQINRGAEYTIKRGTGREITRDEAMDILSQSEKAGLVHLVENKLGMGNAICNCCSCCCEMLSFAGNAPTAGVLAKSRFEALVDAAACTGCQSCIDICPMHAITMDGEVAYVSPKACIGCGLCTTVCPDDAVTLKEVRPKEHIPS